MIGQVSGRMAPGVGAYYANSLLVALCLSLPLSGVSGQVDTTGWRFSGSAPRLVEFEGVQAVLLRNGAAQLPVRFREGTIAFDVAFTDSAGFNGVQFRVQDADNYEDFYFRPHMSGGMDATQYQPVFHGNTGWQLYVGERFNAPLRFRQGTWMRVRIDVSETRAAVYVNDSLAQSISQLLRSADEGAVVIYSRLAPAWFANVRVTPGPINVPRGQTEPSRPPENAVMAWRVSTPLAESHIIGRDSLDRRLLATTWTPVSPSERGFINLGTLHKRTTTENTVLAQFTIDSDRPQLRRVRFGFSDRVSVFLNGRRVYSGDAGYRTRDPRFLGTVGFFDELLLPLERGTNSLVFAVSESSGGWVIGAILDPR